MGPFQIIPIIKGERVKHEMKIKFMLKTTITATFKSSDGQMMGLFFLKFNITSNSIEIQENNLVN